jgi:hypothetical protein
MARGSLLDIGGGTLVPGWHLVEVACVNAGQRSSDSVRIEVRV